MGKTKKSRAYLFAGIIFVMVLVALIVKGDLFIKNFLAESKALPVRAVEIDGVFKFITKKRLADITGKVCAGQNIATLNIQELREEILKEPWVAQVVIKKKMPDTLLLAVIEHVPAAYWNENGLYDAKTKGVFFPDMSEFSQPLVKLGATRDNLCTDVYESAVSFVRAMSNSKYQMVELYLDNVRCYSMTLENGTRLILGRGQKDSLVRLKRFLRSFHQSGLNINDVEYVDLRYDVGFAVGMKEEKKHAVQN